jgi:type I restriction enzyme S subunit
MQSNQISKLELIQAQVSFIPEGWKLDKVGKALVIKNNFRKPISQEVRATMPGNYPYYGPTKIQGYISEYEQDGTYALIGEDGDHFLKYSKMRQTQFISGKCTVNNHAHIIDSSEQCDSKWFYIFFKHRNITNFLSRQGAGRFKLNKATLEKLPLLVPPINEQRKIAKIISSWDKAISTTERLIENSKQQKKALLQQLLAGKRRLLDDSGKAFEGEWENKLFKNILKLDRGSSPRPIVEYITDSEDGVNWIKIGDTKNKDLFINSTKQRITKEGAKKSRKVNKGEIIVSNSMSYGKPYILNIDGYIHDGWFVIRNFEKSLDINFFLQILGSELIQRQYKRLAAGGVVSNISSELVYSVRVDLPTILEQQKIAAVLTNADKETELLEQQLADLKQEKKALMQQLLTGKRRVKIN